MMRFRDRRGERGAAAVEFALVLPVLILLVFGLIEFSRVYNIQISLSNAAREGARTMAVENSLPIARSAAIAAAPSITPAVSGAQITITPTACTKGGTVAVTINYNVSLMTGFFGATLPLTGRGVMRCGG